MPTELRTLASARAFARYARRLPRFLRQPLTAEECRRTLVRRLHERERSFLLMLARAVYGYARSPYRPLLAGAGIELGDLERLVRDDGVERTLERLYEEGVYVTQEEFKHGRPIERLGVGRSFTWHDFDNPFASTDYAGRTGGSRSEGRTIHLDLDRLAQTTVYHAAFFESFALHGRPQAIWRAAPPGTAALVAALQHARLGELFERWFSQTPIGPTGGLAKDFALTAYTVAVSRAVGVPIPFPEHVRAAEASRVARWAAAKRAAGTPPLVSTTASSGVRVCLAAKDEGLDLRETVFRLSGEPLTSGRARVVAEAGAKAVSNYSSSEAGRVGTACAAPTAVDDLHVSLDSLGVIQRAIGAYGERAGALLFTTLRPWAAKVMLNVESDDYGTLEDRACGCYLGELGFTMHVSHVRSYEKLTSEGMTFAGVDLITLLEEVLPARFGGEATDYQLVEEDVDGLPRISLVVSPRVGDVDEQALVGALLDGLARGPAYKQMMADALRDARIVRLVRAEPYVTSGGKIQPLHVAARP